MEQKDLIEQITKQVMAQLSGKVAETPKQTSSSTQKSGSSMGMTALELARYIDHTLLKPESTAPQFDQLCAEAIKYNFFSVCVNSSWVSHVAKKLRGSGVKVCAVIGFPLGEMDTKSKAFEARSAIDNGANELDMVINIGAMKSKNYKLVEDDIRAVKRACRQNTILKVIIETSFLNEEEKIMACELSKKAGADFVKTSTGFTSGGATVQDIALMRRVVGPKMGVKASGGIKDFTTAMAMINAGANRLGLGAGVTVIEGGVSKGGY